MKIIIVMITRDREEFNKKNYYNATMESFERSGLWTSSVEFEFHVFDGGSKNFDFMEKNKRSSRIKVHTLTEVPAPNVNAGRALWSGSQIGAIADGDFVLFVEDDIELCGDFLDSVGAWLKAHNRIDRRVFTFYTPYREVEEAFDARCTAWDYPVEKFYGTQCLATRLGDAASLGDFLMSLPYATAGYDIEAQKWSKERYPYIDFFLASVPCFAQHVGRQSVLFGDDRFHHCGEAFKGENFSPLRAYRN